MAEKIESKRPKLNGFNLNTVASIIVMGCLYWVGQILKTGNEKLEMVSQRLAIIEAFKQTESDQRNRIEGKLDRQQEAITNLQLDMARIKSSNGKP